MGAVVTGLVALSFLADDEPEPAPSASPSTVGTVATTTTVEGVFPPADLERSVCGFLTRDEAEALVGHRLANEPVEPIDGQCSWPDEPGAVIGELYLVVKQREPMPLRDALVDDWGDEQFRFDEVAGLGEAAEGEGGEGLGEEAWFVVRRAGEAAGEPEFVVGVSVHAGEFHVVLGNGGRPSWDGSPAEVKDRLVTAMDALLRRIDERFG